MTTALHKFSANAENRFGKSKFLSCNKLVKAIEFVDGFAAKGGKGHVVDNVEQKVVHQAKPARIG
jgi:hypothetical protein